MSETKVDSRGNEYETDAGSTEPVSDRCSCLLVNYEERYGEKRYCTRLPEEKFIDDGSRFCKTHKSREELTMKASELADTGVFAKTVYHYFDKLSPVKKLLLYRKLESLMDESIYDFQRDYCTRELDFADSDLRHILAEHLEDDILVLEVPYPTEKEDRCYSGLLQAALDGVKALDVNTKLADEGMETEEITDSELVYQEDGSSYWRELTEVTEHHLNLPYDRIVRSRPDLLEYGGVGVDNPEEATDSVDNHIEIYADPTDHEAVDPETLTGDVDGAANIPVSDP